MSGLGSFVLDVLGEIGGGRGEGQNDLPRFALGMVFWASLAVLAFQEKQKTRGTADDSAPAPPSRGSLLFAGFAVGFGREFFMFVVVSARLYGLVSPTTLEYFFPPIEHTLMLVTRVIIASAFLRYTGRIARRTRGYLLLAAVAAAAFYLVSAPIWALMVRDDPALRFSKFWGDWVAHGLGLAFSVAAIVLLFWHADRIQASVVLAFSMFALDDFLMLVNLATGEIHKTIFTPLRHNLYLWAIPVFGYTYIREQWAERSSLEKKLRDSERLEAAGQLAAGVAHDFNNMLQVMMGYTSLAQKRLASGGDTAAALENVQEAGKRAAAVVDQLMSFSQNAPRVMSFVDLNSLVESLAATIDRLLGPHVRIQLDLEGGLPPVWAERSAMEQVVVNLCMNARDAMEGDGTIVITTRTTVLDLSRIERGLTGEPQVSLSIADDGAGMDSETLENARLPFFTTKPSGRGTGLGLATASSVVADHGGELMIESAVGDGTTVTVVLPRSSQPAGSRDKPSQPITAHRDSLI